jgi:hypothetical protein
MKEREEFRTAVQRLLVQQPAQQHRRTSAKNNNTLWTIKGRFKHGKDTGEHLRTWRDGTHVGSVAHAVAFLPRPRTLSDDPAQPTPGSSRIIATWISVSLALFYISSSDSMPDTLVKQHHA